MGINISVKRKFIINQKEYNSIEEMPEDIRESLNKLTHSKAGGGHRIYSTAVKVVFDGKEYKKVFTLPQEISQLYENVVRAAESGPPSSGADIARISGGRDTKPEIISAARPLEIPKPTRVEFVFSPRTLLMSAGLLAFILLLYYLL